MPNNTINQLTEDTSPTSDDFIPTWDVTGGTSKKATVANLELAISPAWASWSPTVVGWASTTVAQTRWVQIGKTVHLAIDYEGTSNSASITFTLPVACSTHLANYEGIPGLVEDVGTPVGPGRWNITPGTNANLLNVFINSAGGGFNSSGIKVVRAVITYEAA